MELLQLIFSVLAGLGAGAMGALFVARSDEHHDRVSNATERLDELEQKTAADRERIEQLSETASANKPRHPPTGRRGGGQPRRTFRRAARVALSTRT